MSNTSGSNELKIFFFGDSICVGQGTAIHHGWVCRLAAQLEIFSEKTSRPVIVTNASVNGNTTRQALERMPYDIQSHQPDIVVIQFGMNDCNYWKTDQGIPRVSRQAYKANLKEMIERCFHFNAYAVLLLTSHPTTLIKNYTWVNTSYETSRQVYSHLVREVFHEYKDKKKLTLIDIERSFQKLIEYGEVTDRDLLLADQLHLSLTGHKYYFDVVYPFLEKIVKKAPTHAT